MDVHNSPFVHLSLRLNRNFLKDLEINLKDSKYAIIRAYDRNLQFFFDLKADSLGIKLAPEYNFVVVSHQLCVFNLPPAAESANRFVGVLVKVFRRE